MANRRREERQKTTACACTCTCGMLGMHLAFRTRQGQNPDQRAVSAISVAASARTKPAGTGPQPRAVAASSRRGRRRAADRLATEQRADLVGRHRPVRVRLLEPSDGGGELWFASPISSPIRNSLGSDRTKILRNTLGRPIHISCTTIQTMSN